MNKKRGFTLIELLVVIAIIGILSSIVLASLNNARGRAQDAAIRADLAQIRNQGELFYQTNNNSYVDAASFCNDATIDSILAHAAVQAGQDPAAGGYCNASASTFVVGMPLRQAGGNWWCVDSNGASRQTGGLSGVLTACPAN